MEPCRKHGGRVEGELALHRILRKLTMNRYENFESHTLDEHGNLFFCGELPERLRFDDRGFETLWHLHPQEYHTIMMHARAVATPRWQQAYGADYHYTGRTNRALPLPEECRSILAWSRDVVDEKLNGLLLNWYDGQLGHYIGPHHDSTTRMVVGVPIVTISLGEERIFRVSHPKTSGGATSLHGTGRCSSRRTTRTWRGSTASLVSPAGVAAAFRSPSGRSGTPELPLRTRHRNRRLEASRTPLRARRHPNGVFVSLAVVVARPRSLANRAGGPICPGRSRRAIRTAWRGSATPRTAPDPRRGTGLAAAVAQGVECER